jgi:hypothetical protein
MHAPEDMRRTVSPSKTKGAQRRRRLSRGLQRWDLDRQMCAEPTRRVATVTLTVAERDPEAAIGRVYDFWARVRRRWLGTRYFCWLELQARGAVHYHCVWLNPPHVKKVNLLAWVERAWGGGRTQVRFADGRGGLERELKYALEYAKKMGRKRYQQKYDGVPRQLRTFMSQRLEIPPPRLDHAIEGDVYQYHPESVYRGQRTEPFLELVGRRAHHVPPGGRCEALDYRRPRAGPAARRLGLRGPP